MILLLAPTRVCGASSIVTLSRDALEIGSDGHPYLRYLNVKLRREAMIPIGPRAAEQIRRQQRYLEDTYGPSGTRFLLPSPPEGQLGWSRGRGGRCHIIAAMVNDLVKTYVRKAEYPRRRGEARDIGSSAPVPPPPRDQPGQRRSAAAGDSAGA